MHCPIILPSLQLSLLLTVSMRVYVSIWIPLSFYSICYFTRVHCTLLPPVFASFVRSAKALIHLPMKLFLMLFQSLHYLSVHTNTHSHAQLHMNIHKYIMIQIYTVGRFHGNIRTTQQNTNAPIHSMCIHHIFRLCVYAVHPVRKFQGMVAQCAFNLTNSRTKTLLIVR